MKRKFPAILVATLLLLGGCGTYQSDPPKDDAASPAGSEFTMAYNGVVTLNPILSHSSNDHNVLYLTQLELVRYYGDEVQCDAAESYELSDDGTVYTFRLRDGLVWSDETPLTAADFEYAFYCLLNPEMGSPSADSWSAVKNASAYNSGEITDWEEVGVKALDDRTLEITMEYPLATFDKTIACKGLYPLREDFVGQTGDKLGSSVDTMMFSGPYVITDWTLGTSLELEKNELYWDSENAFPTKRLNFIEVEDENTKVAMFENGEVDAIETITSEYYDLLEDYIYRYVGGGFMFLWMNGNGSDEETGKLLSNVNFRRALNYGYDRSATMLAVDRNQPASVRLVDSNFTAPGGGKFVDAYPADTAPLNGDPAKAKAYMDKALEDLGYSDLSQLPPLRLVTWDSPQQKLLLETILDQWKRNLGLTNIELNQFVIGTAIGAFYELDYDIFCISWETDVLPTDIMAAMVSGGETNFGIWSNPEFDRLVKEAQTELDPEKQAGLTARAEQIFLDDAAIQPIFENGHTSAVQSYVKGFQMTSISAGYQFNELVVEK
ncbi:MAG: peptide ABC transporter substrate-binding protein [Clostridiales Family XIII bacterium]|jgi:oligopeptide transport system substrate-binding protein|nr:peptide ABC transporter substrate-binding protein [Clostridiales Family XIII bacterium]